MKDNVKGKNEKSEKMPKKGFPRGINIDYEGVLLLFLSVG